METGKKAPSRQAYLFNKAAQGLACWHRPALRRPRKTDLCEFQGSLISIMNCRPARVHGKTLSSTKTTMSAIYERAETPGEVVFLTHPPSHLQHWKRARWGARSKGTPPGKGSQSPGIPKEHTECLSLRTR